MTTATIHSFYSSTSGDWPAGAGALGYWIKAAATNGTATSSLPASVTVCEWSVTPGYRVDGSGSARLMALPDGGRNASSWSDYLTYTINITTTGPTRIAMHGYSSFGSITAGITITDSAGTTLASSSVAVNGTTECAWLEATINGSVKIQSTNASLRIQGILFSATGVGSPLRLLSCIEPGSTGLFS